MFTFLSPMCLSAFGVPDFFLVVSRWKGWTGELSRIHIFHFLDGGGSVEVNSSVRGAYKDLFEAPRCSLRKEGFGFLGVDGHKFRLFEGSSVLWMVGVGDQ